MDAIGRFDRVLLFLNGLLLLTVAAIPFPTGLLAHYLQAGHDQTPAAVAYGLTMSSMSVAFSMVNLYARRYRIKMVPLDWVGFSLGLGLWPMATITAFFNVTLALTLYAFVVLFYIALPITRERRAMAAASGDGALGLAHGDPGTAKTRGGDLGEDP
jgi:uncharacterized membrane protein